MSSEGSLIPARDLARQRERQAAAQIAEKQRIAEEQTTKLAMLRQYQQEYKKNSGGNAVMDIARLRSLRTFLGNLNDALGQQQELVAQAEREVERAQKQWRQARSRAMALEMLIENRIRDRERRNDQREQAAIDDLVTQRHQNNG